MAEMIKGLTYDKFGTTIRVKIGNFDRDKKILHTTNYLFFEDLGDKKKFIKKTSVINSIKFRYPVIYRTKFEHEELNKYFVIEEGKTND